MPKAVNKYISQSHHLDVFHPQRRAAESTWAKERREAKESTVAASITGRLKTYDDANWL